MDKGNDEERRMEIVLTAEWIGDVRSEVAVSRVEKGGDEKVWWYEA